MRPGVELIEYHSLYAPILGPESVVLDLGANHGRFSEKMRTRFGVQCHAVEASPQIFESLTQKTSIKSYHYAIAGKNGPVALSLSDNNLASTIVAGTPDNDTTVNVPGIDLETFVRQIGVTRIDLLKVDIEGAEIAMFDSCSDERLQSIRQMTVEFHDFCGLIPPREVTRVLDRMTRLGFRWIRFSRVGHQDTWLVNSRLVDLSDAQFAYYKYVLRNLRGAERIARKIIFGSRWAEGYQ